MRGVAHDRLPYLVVRSVGLLIQLGALVRSLPSHCRSVDMLAMRLRTSDKSCAAISNRASKPSAIAWEQRDAPA
jgi:hypothetical protein